jgi:hypothetical protein
MLMNKHSLQLKYFSTQNIWSCLLFCEIYYANIDTGMSEQHLHIEAEYSSHETNEVVTLQPQ